MPRMTTGGSKAMAISSQGMILLRKFRRRPNPRSSAALNMTHSLWPIVVLVAAINDARIGAHVVLHHTPTFGLPVSGRSVEQAQDCPLARPDRCLPARGRAA